MVNQIIRHWLMANCARANKENVSMRAAVMVFATTNRVPVDAGVPYGTPVPAYRYSPNGQLGDLESVEREARTPLPSLIVVPSC